MFHSKYKPEWLKEKNSINLIKYKTKFKLSEKHF